MNGVDSNMSMSRCRFKVSSAKNAGIFSNSGTAKVAHTSFEGGYAATHYVDGHTEEPYGGAVDNQGDFTCFVCDFKNNSARQLGLPDDQTANANGAVINMDQKAGATALFLNCTIEASDDHQQNPWTVSEFYMGNKDVQLNLTFTTVTNCHDNTLMINNDKTFDTATMRGTHFCDSDKSETAGACATHERGQLRPGCAQTVKNCSTAKAEEIWQCGSRATCTDLFTPGKTNVGLGINCSCHNPSLHYEPKIPGEYHSMWGWPFGGAHPDMSPLALGGADFEFGEGFEGCLEQWNPFMSNVTAALVPQEYPKDMKKFAPTALDLYPALNFSGDLETRTDAYTCVTRAAAGLNWTVTANLSDHNHIDGKLLSNHTFQIKLSPGQPFVSTAFVGQAWDANVTGGVVVAGHTAGYTLNATMVPGDLLCGEGVNATTCYNESGAPALCRARACEKEGACDCFYKGADPDYSGSCEFFNGTMPCAEGPDTAPACNYAQYNFSQCECMECLPEAVYACECKNGLAPDGTLTCAEDGTKGDCDCSALWSFPPSPPPPNAPPPPPPLWPKIVFPSIVGGGALLGGFFCWYRRRRAAQMRQQYQDALLNAGGSEAGDDGEAEYNLQ